MGKLIDLADEEIVNPIDSALPAHEKIKALQALSKENEPVIQKLLRDIDSKYGTESKTSHKEPQAIADKANRQSIKDVKPWHDVEHIRDSFRFKTVLKDLEDLPKIAEQLKEANIEVIKTDTEKVLEPGPWGWRIAVFDLQMPNGQLVEYYLPVEEMEQAKKDGNHDLFEKWRNVDTEQLSDSQQQQYENALEQSNDKYDTAWQTYIDRTKQKPERIREVLEKAEKVFEKPKEKNIDKPPQEKKPSKLIQRLKEQKMRSREDDLTR